ncbi:hypothetical protein DZF91_36755 [Actinomadura logoneensis]|uniref:Uncharacterized protein n=1 Tax=Actinomadura logoneensis TaxID=2293572 RepID=A0A372J9L1_9ACTN|nr:hypothetical protein [Actinomadura logoneensis]RFU36705.1 hypothetical protein DZF91_36755 [Actinomadura logoneensis]
MPKSWMIADFLRPYAQWRIDRADERDDGRNARAAIGLIDAAAYAMQLDDGDRLIIRLASAGCFDSERFDPGADGERLVRRWHYDGLDGAPRDLLAALADAAEHGRGDTAPPPPRTSPRWRALGGSHRALDDIPSPEEEAAAAWFAQATGKCPMDALNVDDPQARPADTPAPESPRFAEGGDAYPADAPAPESPRFAEGRDACPAHADSPSGADSRFSEPDGTEKRSSRHVDGPGARGEGGKSQVRRAGKGGAPSPRPPRPRRG